MRPTRRPELQADLATRVERNETAASLAEKASKRDVASSRARLLDAWARHTLSSKGRVPLPNHLLLDTTDLTPGEAAARIADHFGRPQSTK